MPDWLATAYARGYQRVLNCSVDSWDKAFGAPIPKGVQLARLRFNRKARFAVHAAVVDAISREPRRAIDAALFEQIGKSIGAGKTRAEELYREAVALGGIDAVELKRQRGGTLKPASLRKLAGLRRTR